MLFSHQQNCVSLANTHSHNRRSILKGLTLFLTAGVLSLCPRMAYAMPENTKILVIFFSKTGNTRMVAQQIHTLVGGDIVELKTVQGYPDDHDATVSMAVQERKNDARPSLSTQFSENMDAYDLVFVGYPVWEYTMPMALFSFFDQFKFAGKTIVPFSTHQGSGLGHGPEDIARLCPQARLLKGLAVRGKSAANAQQEVSKFVQSL